MFGVWIKISSTFTSGPKHVDNIRDLFGHHNFAEVYCVDLDKRNSPSIQPRTDCPKNEGEGFAPTSNLALPRKTRWELKARCTAAEQRSLAKRAANMAREHVSQTARRWPTSVNMNFELLQTSTVSSL